MLVNHWTMMHSKRGLQTFQTVRHLQQEGVGCRYSVAVTVVYPRPQQRLPFYVNLSESGSHEAFRTKSMFSIHDKMLSKLNRGQWSPFGFQSISHCEASL